MNSVQNLLVKIALAMAATVAFSSPLCAQNSAENIRSCDRYSGATASAKITAAIADLPSTGGTVDCRSLQGAQTIASTVTISKPVQLKLCAATFAMRGDFHIASNNVEIEGCGDQTILSIAAGASFRNNAPISGLNASNIRIHDLAITGGCAASSTFNSAQKGVYFTATTSYYNVVVDHMHVSGMCGEGLYADIGSGSLGSTGRIDFTDNIVEHGAGVNAINVNFTGVADCRISRNRINDMKSKGIEGPANGCVISENIISNVLGDGIFINNYATTTKVRTTIANNRLRAGGTFNSNGGITVGGWGVTVIGNDVTGWTGPCIYLTNLGGATNRGSDNLLAGNVCHGNSTLGTSYFTGEIVQDGGSNNAIIGNNLYQETTATRPIVVQSGTATFIDGNTFTGFGANWINDLGAGTIYGNNAPNYGTVKKVATVPLNWTPQVPSNTTNNWLTASGRDQFTECNNHNGSAQDDATKASWCIDFGALNDQFRIKRAPAGGALTTVFRVLNGSAIGLGDSGPIWTSGTGAPKGVCATGSLYTDTTGGKGTTLYVCESAAWAPK